MMSFRGVRAGVLLPRAGVPRGTIGPPGWSGKDPHRFREANENEVFRMTTAGFALAPWTPDQTAILEAWGHDRPEALQAGLDGALALMLDEDVLGAPEPGPVAPLRGEGETIAALFGDLLDDLFEQIAVHGPVEAVVLDGVLKRDREGLVAWGYLFPRDLNVPITVLERAGNVEAVVETPEEIRLRVMLRRLA